MILGEDDDARTTTLLKNCSCIYTSKFQINWTIVFKSYITIFNALKLKFLSSYFVIFCLSPIQGCEGAIVSVGGQIPNNLALPLYNNGVNILGTNPTMIDSAENRSVFSAICDKLSIKQPEWRALSSIVSFCIWHELHLTHSSYSINH